MKLSFIKRHFSPHLVHAYAMILHKRILRIMYDILSLMNSTL